MSQSVETLPLYHIESVNCMHMKCYNHVLKAYNQYCKSSSADAYTFSVHFYCAVCLVNRVLTRQYNTSTLSDEMMKKIAQAALCIAFRHFPIEELEILDDAPLLNVYGLVESQVWNDDDYRDSIYFALEDLPVTYFVHPAYRAWAEILNTEHPEEMHSKRHILLGQLLSTACVFQQPPPEIKDIDLMWKVQGACIYTVANGIRKFHYEEDVSLSNKLSISLDMKMFSYSVAFFVAQLFWIAGMKTEKAIDKSNNKLYLTKFCVDIPVVKRFVGQYAIALLELYHHHCELMQVV